MIIRVTNATGDKISVCVPDLSSITSMTKIVANVPSFTADSVATLSKVCPLYEPITLFVRTNEQKVNASLCGFPDVYSLEELGNTRWTLDNGSSINFDGTSIRYESSDGTTIMGVNVGTRGGSGLRYPINTVDVGGDFNTNVNYRYRLFYLRLTALTSAGFTIEFSNANLGDSPIAYYGPYSQDNISKESFDLWIDYYTGIKPVPTEDPYTPGGEAEEGGGTGTFDNTSVDIPVPDLPTTSAVETGFISLYKPSLVQLRALATYLWSANGLDLNTFKRIFSDPISAILGLSLVPIDPGMGPDVSVVLGNVDTGVHMPRIPQQYLRFNCGSLDIQEYWGGYLDYAPYTRAEIYLPFIGVKPLNIDDIMGKTISLWYVVDFLSGGCVACLECGGSVLYQFIGQCACSVPITGNDMTNVINGILSVVGAGVGAMVATGGMGLAGLAATGALASNVMGMKTHVEKSGSMGGMGGMLGVKTPYIILTRPRQALPAEQNTFTGYPSFITTTLGNCSGYTVVHEIHIEGLSATDDEKREIDQLLKGGVIL